MNPASSSSTSAQSDPPAALPVQSDTSKAAALPRRIAVGLTLSAVFIGGMIFDKYLKMDLVLQVLVLITTMMMLREFYRLSRAAGAAPLARFGLVAGAALVILHWLSLPGVLGRVFEWLSVRTEIADAIRPELMPLGAAAVVMAAFFCQAFQRDVQASRLAIANIGATLLGLLYVMCPTLFLVRIRHLGLTDGGALLLGGETWNETGFWLLLQTVVVVKMMDTGAYFTGRAIGRTKLIPRISPGKTWEGLAGGFVAAVATAIAFQHFRVEALTDGAFTLIHAVVFGLLVGFAGQAGDLAESLLKRSVGAKDAGTLLPGFGGALDVMDSFLSAAPVAYVIYIVSL